VNREAFLELADRIELEGRFDLGFYASHPDRVNAFTGHLISDCGTVGCVAGWACAIAGVSHHANSEYDIWTDACRWLGIPREVARRLFYAAGDSVWVELAETLGLTLTDDGDEVYDWSSISAVQAAKVLRMIADGEVEL
jgi:hypothetical protein